MLREIRLTAFKLDEAGDMVRVEEPEMQEPVFWKSNTCWICESFQDRARKRPSNTYEDFDGLRRHHKCQHVKRWPCHICNQPQGSEAQRRVIYII